MTPNPKRPLLAPLGLSLGALRFVGVACYAPLAGAYSPFPRQGRPTRYWGDQAKKWWQVKDPCRRLVAPLGLCLGFRWLTEIP